MGTAVVLADGPRVALVSLGPGGAARDFPLGPGPLPAAEKFLALGRGEFPPALGAALRGLPGDVTVVAVDPRWLEALGRLGGHPARLASTAEVRAARVVVFRAEAPEDRAFLLGVARLGLERALASPEEVLISLAREEERVERAVGREARALNSFVAVGGTLLEEYESAWSEARSDLARHHAALVGLLERSARTVAPNLAEVVGERVAGRLVAAAGSLAALGRMSSSRIQLLGSRRRPSPERGPRYGVLYRGVRMNDLPVARRGAYARSLASLAAVAARADATTHSRVAPSLVARRDRRVEQLRRRAR